MRLPVRSLRSLRRRLDRWPPNDGWPRFDRWPLVAVVALAATGQALEMATGSSDGGEKRASRGVAPEGVGDSGVAWSTAASVKRVRERHGGPRRGGPAYYRRTTRKHVTEEDVRKFVPLYREAERVYRVNWLLIASIHRQETAFSTASSTYHGLNPFGCCAGPMQFNVTNGPPSTWKLYRESYRDGRRPERYPHRTRSHPSIYDDFDAIMAAGALLRDSGAGRSLDRFAWGAAYDYYGHDLFGITYASQILARAEGWQRDGFCANCAVDERLVQEFDDAYGEPVREQLLADERRDKERKRRKRRRDKNGERKKRAERDADERARRRARERDRRRAKEPPARKDPPARRRKAAPVKPAPAPTQPSTTTPQPAPPPPAPDCTLIRRLLGC